MADDVEGDELWDYIGEIRATSDRIRLEEAADFAAAAGERAAIPALLDRIGDSLVQDDRDTEDAVCQALVALDVMDFLGNLNFRFKDLDTLDAEIRTWIDERPQTIPWKYFRSPRPMS